MAKSQRDKGKRAEREFRLLLADRDLLPINTADGTAVEDALVMMSGMLTAWEVKHQKLWKLAEWRKQAKDQAQKRRALWALAVRIEGHPKTFYVEGEAIRPTVWRGK